MKKKSLLLIIAMFVAAMLFTACGEGSYKKPSNKKDDDSISEKATENVSDETTKKPSGETATTAPLTTEEPSDEPTEEPSNEPVDDFEIPDFSVFIGEYYIDFPISYKDIMDADWELDCEKDDILEPKSYYLIDVEDSSGMECSLFFLNDSDEEQEVRDCLAVGASFDCFSSGYSLGINENITAESTEDEIIDAFGEADEIIDGELIYYVENSLGEEGLVSFIVEEEEIVVAYTEEFFNIAFEDDSFDEPDYDEPDYDYDEPDYDYDEPDYDYDEPDYDYDEPEYDYDDYDYGIPLYIGDYLVEFPIYCVDIEDAGWEIDWAWDDIVDAKTGVQVQVSDSNGMECTFLFYNEDDEAWELRYCDIVGVMFNDTSSGYALGSNENITVTSTEAEIIEEFGEPDDVIDGELIYYVEDILGEEGIVVFSVETEEIMAVYNEEVLSLILG